MDPNGIAVRKLKAGIPLAEVGRRGSMELVLGCRDGRTAILHSYCEVPFKVTRPVTSAITDAVHVVLMQCTAGIFGGDILECSIDVRKGARALITQQAATRIHPSGALPGLQHIRIRVEEGAQVHLYLEPVIPFRGSRFRQSTSLCVSEGATVFFWEAFMAGRVGHGERWQFEELTSETSLEADGRLLYLDRFALTPRGNPESEWAMKRASYVATGVCFGAGAASFAERLHEALPHAGVDTPEDRMAIVRAVTEGGPDYHRAKETFASLTGWEQSSR